MRRRSLLSAALGAAFLVPLTGCGDVRARATSGAAGSAGAREAVNAAARKIKAAGGVAVDYATRTRDGEVELREKGRMSARTRPAPAFDRICLELWENGERRPSGGHNLMVDRDFYIQQSGSWMKVPEEELRRGIEADLLKGFRNLDLLAQLRLIASSEDVEEVGREVIEGVPTTRYTGTTRVSDGGFDLWIDDRRLPRRLAMSGTSHDEDGGPGTWTKTLLVREVGDGVEIGRPAAETLLPPWRSGDDPLGG